MEICLMGFYELGLMCISVFNHCEIMGRDIMRDKTAKLLGFLFHAILIASVLIGLLVMIFVDNAPEWVALFIAIPIGIVVVIAFVIAPSMQ